MAGKRSAVSDLNHDNWDQEDDIEEAGSFQKASDDVLKRRIIKTARRRAPQVTTGNDDDENKKQVFGGFKGFSSFAPPNPNSAFSFLSNSNTVKSSTAKTTTSTATSETPKVTIQNCIVFTNGIEAKDKKTESIDTKKNDSNDDNDESERSEYYAKLKGLNESVLSWIEKHVKENPFISLKPIFADYDRYLTDLEVKHVTVSAETKKELSTFSFKSSPVSSSTSISAFASNAKSSEPKETITFGKTTTPKETISFGKPSEPKETQAFGVTSRASTLFTTNSSSTSKFSFGVPASKPTTNETEKKDSQTTSSPFLFGSANASKSAGNEITSKVFSFGSGSTMTAHKTSSIFGNTSTPFPFGGPPATVTTEQKESDRGTEEDEDEPPKVEFTPVVEQDHIYTIKCKVFVKKDGNFGERGVGNLFLKKVPDSEKVQLIVRADTNLGNLLCNFILSQSIPTQRMGKKDVMLVCIPTPDAKPPPVPILLRVKSSEDADGLLQELEKHKK